MTVPFASGRPLEGIRVLDLTRVLAGPFAALILGDLGADVIKIEKPGQGEFTRTVPPFVGPGGRALPAAAAAAADTVAGVGAAGAAGADAAGAGAGGVSAAGAPVPRESHYFLSINRNKRSLALDVGRPEGRQVFLDLVRVSDVVLENFRPGVMEALGLGWDVLSAVNPRVIGCSISGFGLSGPLRDKTSFDIVTQAMSGAMSVTGEPGGPPVKLGIPMGDLVGGFYGAIGVLAALQERQRTGRGQPVEISLHDGMVSLLGYLAGLYFATGESPGAVGTAHPNIVPYQAFRVADGWLIVAAFTEVFWQKLCRAMGLAELLDDPRFRTNPDRVRHRRELLAILEPRFRERTLAEWCRVLEEGDVPHAPILSVGEALEHPHLRVRRMVTEVEHPVLGPVRLTGRPIKFPLAEEPPIQAPPPLGYHTEEILTGLLGYGPERIRALAAAGVVGLWE